MAKSQWQFGRTIATRLDIALPWVEIIRDLECGLWEPSINELLVSLGDAYSPESAGDHILDIKPV